MYTLQPRRYSMFDRVTVRPMFTSSLFGMRSPFITPGNSSLQQLQGLANGNTSELRVMSRDVTQTDGSGKPNVEHERTVVSKKNGVVEKNESMHFQLKDGRLIVYDSQNQIVYNKPYNNKGTVMEQMKDIRAVLDQFASTFKEQSMKRKSRSSRKKSRSRSNSKSRKSSTTSKTSVKRNR